MSITNWTELNTALTNWLARSDQVSRYPEFIALAEADMRRNLRKKVTVGALTVDSATEALPATVLELRAMRFNTTDIQYPITETSYAALADLRRTGSGRPHYYAVVGSTVYFDVVPDTAYTTEIMYYESVPALTAVNTTNIILTDSPDLYLYGSLIHAAPYLEHDERIGTWQTLYQKALDDENALRERAELSAAPMIIGLPIVFG